MMAGLELCSWGWRVWNIKIENLYSYQKEPATLLTANSSCGWQDQELKLKQFMAVM